MAFGFTPKYTLVIAFETLTSEQILIIGLEAAKNLGWNIGYTSEHGFIAYTKFSWTSWSEEVSIKIANEMVTLKSECTGSQFVDWGKNKKNIDDFLVAFKTCSETISQEDIANRLQEIKSSATSSDDLLNQPPQTSRDKITGFFSIFIPTEGYFITPILANLNIIIFLLMVFSGVDILLPDNQDLLNWGANFRPLTLEGQAWRLFTCCFIHIGVFHLLMNVYALIYIGMLLEPQLGRTRFLTAYILSGIMGSVISLYWHDLTISAGASGAIFGMYGVFLAMLTTNLIEKSARKTFLTSILIFVGYNLLNGLKGGIDNAAHLGGLLAGIVIGYSFYPSLTKPKELNLKYITIGLPVLLMLVTSFLVYSQTSNDILTYEEKMKKFISMESMALEIYNSHESTPDEQLLEEINDRGLYYWKECLKVVRDADKLEIPQELHDKNKKLMEYCQLRIKSYELLYKTINEDTDKYQTELTEYNSRIKNIIDELGGGQ